MRYWWVNHKQTARQEIDGGYLWSPKRTTDNRRSQFYDNMSEADLRDLVLSYADARISNFGRVTASASDGRKPTEFGDTGEKWSDAGWRLPVAWTALPRPVEPRRHLNDIGPLLPSKYSPFSLKAKRGNQGAYLAEISEALFRYILNQARAEQPRRARQPQRRIRDVAPPETERTQITKARIGQGLFRIRIMRFGEDACRITGIDNPRLLIASHIKPWRACTNAERLDGANGLLLTPHIDRLFDRGLISFENDGQVKVSPKVTDQDLDRLGLTGLRGRNVGPFREAQAIYLDHHRRVVFVSK
jgi:putative restriction endonuclease